MIREPCRKCAYIRQPTDKAPEWQCPACGVAYAKVVEFQESQLYPPTTYVGAYRARPEPGIAWKKWCAVMAVAVGCAAGYNGFTKRMAGRTATAPPEPPASSASAPAGVAS